MIKIVVKFLLEKKNIIPQKTSVLFKDFCEKKYNSSENFCVIQRFL